MHKFISTVPRATRIPLPPADFRGRSAEIETCRSHLCGGTIPDCLNLVGLGGIGESTLAQALLDDRTVQMRFTKRLWDRLPGQNLESRRG